MFATTPTNKHSFSVSPSSPPSTTADLLHLVTMSSLLCRAAPSTRTASRAFTVRTLATTAPEQSTSTSASSSFHSLDDAPNTHYKITLRRSAISLGEKKQGTLKAMGIHRRHQTVYFPFGPEMAGNILAVKELLEVENVPAHKVMTVYEQKQARKPPRGYKVVGTKKNAFMNL
ncbi:hypothetical protein D9619_004650 [Psilocybe cf. subviscida]|uniref:Large ribosomal subunit protein uL30-like ferredoxin-like fold domain-containing protein n=1 Tax=Psilocybe cf. subviscida TaxID=2480587 RepID=A0A8H5BQM9_9AGAR|nr:hypothetical protein D9619_004650 [Psilocybe cf. subviscida]